MYNRERVKHEGQETLPIPVAPGEGRESQDGRDPIATHGTSPTVWTKYRSRKEAAVAQPPAARVRSKE